MKRFKLLPSFIRWLLITFLILGIVAGGVYAYIALTGQGQIIVVEPLSWVGSNTFTVSLYPQEGITVTLTLANDSSVALETDFTYTIIPNPVGKGLTVTLPNKLIVPATGQASFNVGITASKSAEPGTYNITIEVNR